MRINTNLSAFDSHRHLQVADRQLAKSLERLSSGLRVNRGSDDAAGLQISETLRAQVAGDHEASKNCQDGISLTRVADGGLNEIASLLQRGRQLAVQAANGVLTTADRTAVQAEVSQIALEVTNIAQTTTFNGISVLQGNPYTQAQYQTVLTALQSNELRNAWSVDAARYGFGALDLPNNLTISLDASGPANVLAYVQGSSTSPQMVANNVPTLSLHVIMGNFLAGSPPGTGAAPIYNARVLAHELVHAWQFDEANGFNQPTWFEEGSAEFVHGADERIAADLGTTTPSAAQVQSLLNRISPTSWGGTSADYSAATIAIRYLAYKASVAEGASGNAETAMQAIYSYLKADQTRTVNSVLSNPALSGFATPAAFYTDLANGTAAAWAVSAAPGHLTLGDADTGSVAGSDWSGGAALTASSTVPTSGNTALPWNVIYPTAAQAAGAGGGPVILQIGANNGMSFALAPVTADASALGVGNLDVVNAAGAAITAFSDAIQQVSAFRASFGADENRLEHTINNLASAEENQQAADSRIRDTDVASEMTTFTRTQILQQSATSVLAQANARPRMVLALLR